MYRTCNIFYMSKKTYNFQLNHPISQYLPLFKPYLQLSKPS